jgi:DNA-binding IclR family transcriptional regulator
MLNKTDAASGEYEVAAVRKALELLCEFTTAGTNLSVSELSRRLGMPKSTTHNLLRTLEALDFLKQDPADRRYRLGPRVYELGLSFSQSTHLVSAAAPHLQWLADATKETVKLALLSCDQILIVAAVESPYQLHTRGDVGMRAPLHCTGLGKAILATLDTEEVREIVARRGLAPATPHTIGTLDRLLEELERVRASGYSVDWEENEVGVVCVAAAVSAPVDGSVAALSVSAPSSRLDKERIRAYSRLVLQTARAVEKAAGVASSRPRRDGSRAAPDQKTVKVRTT